MILPGEVFFLAGDFSTVLAGELSTLFAGDFDTVLAGDLSTLFAGDFDTVLAGDFDTVLAGDLTLFFLVFGAFLADWVGCLLAVLFFRLPFLTIFFRFSGL